MSMEKKFAEKPGKKPIKGEGFTVKEGDFFGERPGPNVEFRPGETSETALARQEKERESAEKSYQERSEKEANMSPEERAQQMEKQMQRNRRDVVDFFEGLLERKGEYSEVLKIKPDGNLDHRERVDGGPPFIVDFISDSKSPDDLRILIDEILKEYPELDISFEVDPKKQWVKYRVTKKV